MLTENDISYLVRGACFKVFNNLGPGLLESVYEAALAYELKKEGCLIQCQLPLPVVYEDIVMDIGFRLDMLVNEMLIVEIKSVESLNKVHFKQLMTYLKLTDLRLGLLINFNTSSIAQSIHRVVNGLEC